MSLTRDEQRAARAAGQLAADALIHDVFPECHIGGGSSHARGWPEGYDVEWDRKSYRVMHWDDAGTAEATRSREEWARFRRDHYRIAVEVKWSQIRKHGRAIPAICDALRDAIAADRAAHRKYDRAKNYHEKGDPEAPFWKSRIVGPVNAPAIEAAWDTLLIATSATRARINALLDQAFPLAADDSPADLLELLGALS